MDSRSWRCTCTCTCTTGTTGTIRINSGDTGATEKTKGGGWRRRVVGCLGLGEFIVSISSHFKVVNLSSRASSFSSFLFSFLFPVFVNLVH
jgi:hypothetical protein